MPRLGRGVASVVLAIAVVSGAAAQEKKEEEKPKTLWEEITWFGYVESSYVFNLRGSSETENNLRLYDSFF